MSIGIITLPAFKPGNVPSSNLVNVLCALSGSVYVITDNKRNVTIGENKEVYIYTIEYKEKENLFASVVNHALTELKISYKIAKLRKKVYCWVFFIGGDTLLLPLLTAKMFKKKVILALAGSSLEVAKNRSKLFVILVKLLRNINFILSKRIIIYSRGLVEKWNLKKYKKKILIGGGHFLDFNKFQIKKQLGERDNLVSYIGKLDEKKGILNLLDAIQRILLGKNDNIRFLIVGDGELWGIITNYLKEKNLNTKIKLIEWMSHDELPRYFNESKLIVIPSYSEGLPNVMLEAMACGTPVLVTPVGAIPDIIKDGETGFILEDNSPETIAKGITSALNHPNLEQVAANARALVEQEFTYEAAVERYRKIFEDLLLVEKYGEE